ncbi:cbb3-type cytochrome c oxidase N-terminal domain-containing protein [Pollutibacter soli]|uniref:cbb3-type cytochrome c oxidase N-terminal domain-containing protein n=1 Tax=Pollutibacter soli TaxID=3034157 RepID=UPI0030136F29
MLLKNIFSRISARIPISVIAMIIVLPAVAQEKATNQVLKNPVTISLIAIMITLLLVIVFLANILLTLAKAKLAREKKNRKVRSLVILSIMLLSSAVVFGQDETAVTASPYIYERLSKTDFFIMISTILLELIIALGMVFNIRRIAKEERDAETEKETKTADLAYAATAIVKKESDNVRWWNRINRFKPIEQEADIDLGHEYDGIRELDNRLPPWWLYGFYLTIFVAVIYLWRYHVSHSAPSSEEEYQMAVKKADEEVKLYLAKKGEDVNENNVVALTSADDLSAGKAIYLKSCAVCHKDNGGGEVGPNLTDDYWLHGSEISKMFKTIRYGINAMPQWQSTYSNKQIAQVASYIQTLHGTNPPGGKAPQGEIDNAIASDSTATVEKLSVK